MSECNVIRGYTLKSADDVLVRIEETAEREEAVLSLSRGGHLETARLTREQFFALVDLKYRIELHEPKEPVTEPVTYQEEEE